MVDVGGRIEDWGLRIEELRLRNWDCRIGIVDYFISKASKSTKDIFERAGFWIFILGN